jgi:uncharacterized protein (DUF305 family)
VAVFLLALAYVGGYIAPGLRTPGDNSAEAGFARDMSVHHSQAVAMSMIAWQNPLLTGTPADVEASRELRTMAYDIATNQQNQIGQMTVWLQGWHLSPTGSRPRMAWMPDGATELEGGLMPGMATPDQLDELSQDSGKKLDILYCQLMLRHHLGGIHMVEGVLKLTDNDQVRTLAQAMQAGQQREVTIMQDLLTALGGQPLPA